MKTSSVLRYCTFAFALIIFIGFAGCAGNYGRFSRDNQVLHAFENNQLSTNYKYFYNGHHNQTYAILGLDPKYKLVSKFWREVEPNTEEFRGLTSRLWEDYDRYRYGAHLLDPSGNQVGVWYSSVHVASIRFFEDHRVEVYLQSPWLGGPDRKGGGARTPF